MISKVYKYLCGESLQAGKHLTINEEIPRLRVKNVVIK